MPATDTYGSLLVLCLVSPRAWSPWLHRAAIVAAAVLFGAQPMFLLVLGQLVSIPPRGAGGLGRGFRGTFLLLLGIALCASKDWSMADTLRL